MEIRKIKKSEWETLRAFNGSEYGSRHILTNKIYYDWQFDNVFNTSKSDYPTLGLFIKGELVGNLGIVPAPAHYFGKTVPANWLANLVVRENLRGMGYGYLLLEKSAAGVELVIDHTINEAAWPMFQKAGWQGGNLKRFLYIIKSKNELYSLKASAPVKMVPTNFNFKQTRDFSGDWDRAWKRLRGRHPITIDRSARYLNWRYARHPLVSYYLFNVLDGSKIIALIVVRFEEVKQDRPIGVKAARIIDFVTAAGSEEFALAKTIEFAKKQGADFIDYFSSGDFHNAVFKKVGFFDGDEPPYNSLPILFNPLSTKRLRLNFAAQGGQGNLNDYYTTKGDGDQDRPY